MTIQEMAMWAIQFLSSTEGEPTQELIDNIYRISHVALGECTAKHEDWIEFTKKVYAEGSLHGYCPASRKQRESMEKSILFLHGK